MTEFKDVVYRQSLLLEAEQWALGVRNIHVHSLNSMWYDDRPTDTANGNSVTDITYNNGLIERKQNGKIIHYFGRKLEGQELIDQYLKGKA
tara:strand:- start:1721 stop:1993 length:273 start_codon:yes stop_codon:yes gene_type:complete